MTAQVERVVERLVRIASYHEHVPTSDDIEAIGKMATYYAEEGWAEDDLVDYFKHSEEINPNLDEDTAIRRMVNISDKYR
jgi:hypothetical protein